MTTIRREFFRGVHIGAVLACIIFAGLLVWTVLR
jgi:Mg/Co/Ni transporter MgtE